MSYIYCEPISSSFILFMYLQSDVDHFFVEIWKHAVWPVLLVVAALRKTESDLVVFVTTMILLGNANDF